MVECIDKYLLCVYCSNAARASGITALIKGAEIDEAFSKLLLQAIGEVQVRSVHWLYVMITLIIQKSQPAIFYKVYIIQPEDTSMDHLVQSFQKLPVSVFMGMGEYNVVGASVDK